jgi:hypothetical protein
MEDPTLFDRLCESFPELRFILPVRDPLDCAISNRRTGHSFTLGLPIASPVNQVLEAVLRALAWALEKRDQHPDRIFAFTQDQPAEILLPRLADFLGVEPTASWLEDGAKMFLVRDRYEIPPGLAAHAKKQINATFARWPDIAAAFA